MQPTAGVAVVHMDEWYDDDDDHGDDDGEMAAVGAADDESGEASESNEGEG